MMSVGKTSDDGNISILTKDGVTAHNEQDVLKHAKAPPSSSIDVTSTAANAFH